MSEILWDQIKSVNTVMLLLDMKIARFRVILYGNTSFLIYLNSYYDHIFQ